MYVKQNGKIKDTQVNRIIALTYYGYRSTDIVEILGTSTGHIHGTLQKYSVETTITRPLPLTMFATKAEKDLFEGYKDKLSKVYHARQAELSTDTKEEEPALVKEELKVAKPTKVVAKRQEKVAKKPSRKLNLGDVMRGGKGKPELNIKLDTLTSEDSLLPQDEPSVEVALTKSQELVDELHGTGFEREQGYLKYLTEVDQALGADGDCELCGNKGWVMAPSETGIRKNTCPVCLGDSVIKKVARLNDYDKQQLQERYIPNPTYRLNDFDFDLFSQGILLPEELRGYTYERYVEFMNTVLMDLNNRQLPTKSYYIVAPDGYGKKWFGYEVIKLLIEYGYKTTGLLDTIELSELIDKRNYQELKERLDADIIMVSLTGLNKGYYSHVIKYLTEYADSQGKSVFIFSRVEASMLVKGDQGMSGLIFSQTAPYEYGKLMQVGLQGKEHSQAYRLYVNSSNESIGYDPKYKKK